MGILPKHIHLLSMEQSKHPIKGNTLTLGQQAVYATLDEAKSLIKSHDIIPANIPVDFDTKNKIPSWNETYMKRFTNAQTLLTLLGAEKVSVADCSTYEDPDYIMDLNSNIDAQFEENFDVILDVGTLEHVFDIPTALSNLKKMLKRGGQLILILPSSGAIDHGFYSFSPTLLFDFFKNNGFDNFSCYLLEGSQLSIMKKGNVYRYNYIDREFPLIRKRGVEVAFFATKNIGSEGSGQTIKPIQSLYARDIWNSRNTGNTAPKKNTVFRKIGSLATFFMKRYRPEFYNIYKHNKKRKNLSFVGKF
jgi:SAM-dependent methyltransferase